MGYKPFTYGEQLNPDKLNEVQGIPPITISITFPSKPMNLKCKIAAKRRKFFLDVKSPRSGEFFFEGLFFKVR